MATKFSPCKGSYVLNQFPSNVMFGMNGFQVSASGAIQGHHGPLVLLLLLFALSARFIHSLLTVTEKLKFVLGRVENFVGKGENAGHQHFLLSTQSFQKASYTGSLKVGTVW